MQYKPEDFSSDAPPPRTIGTECEYNMQGPPGKTKVEYYFLGSNNMQQSGVPNHEGYLGSEFGSGRAYTDCGHLEFDTAEAVGPASAAVEDLAGIQRISRIINMSNVAYGGLYRLAGTYIPNGLVVGSSAVSGSDIRTNGGRSSGYHVNFLAPRTATDDPLVDRLLPTHTATDIWAMSGTLRDNFVLSQKVWGIGGNPIDRSRARRTQHNDKPMITIPPRNLDVDTIGNSEWARFERRMDDPGLSLVNRFASFAAFSLTIRLVELRQRFNEDALTNMCLKEPVAAAKRFAGNLALDATAETVDGRQLTVLDVQESLLDLFENGLQKEVDLPADERFAIPVIRTIIDGLRQSKPQKADYSPAARMRVEFAPKHMFATHDRPQSEIVASDKAAMHRVLEWDRVLTAGNGLRYWNVVTERDPATPTIRSFAQEFGLSPRAQKRAALVDGDSTGTVISWSRAKSDDVGVYSLGNPIGE